MADITWEQIAAANSTIGTMSIERKDSKTGKTVVKEYAEVNQRVKAFRMVYPTGLISTEILTNENGACVIKATAGYYAEDGHFVTLATGTAFEVQSSSYINKTSYIENCETSAVGRCLGFCGFGIDTSICSAEELSNALEQQGMQRADQTKPIPAEIFGTPIEVVEEPPVPKDTKADADYRVLCLMKFKLEALDASCVRRFGTDFRHTPVSKLKSVLTEESLNKMEDLSNE